MVFKSRKEVVIKAFLNSRMFSSGVFIFSLALIRSCVCSTLILSVYFLFLFSYLSVGVGEEVKHNASYF